MRFNWKTKRQNGPARHARRSLRGKAGGFSLVELIVVIGIFSVISGITVFNYGKFQSSLVITNLAYQAALAVRQAQVYGISVKQTKTNSFDVPYGVWFGENSKDFYLFADTNVGGGTKNKFDINTFDSKEELISLTGSNNIHKFCIHQGTWRCSTGNASARMSIMFKRPNPSALIYDFGGLGDSTLADQAEIQFKSAQGDKIARLTITSTGQISVDTCNGSKNIETGC